MLRESALEYLETQQTEDGETVQLGWFIFRIINSDGRIDLETLDFKEVASFTTDFEIPEQIHWAQQETLQRMGEDERPCTLSDAALVSRSYDPQSPKTFIERSEPTDEGDCGWYVGMTDESLDQNNIDSFQHQSLYELTINDDRIARFWLLPVGYRVYFDEDEPRIEKVEQQVGGSRDDH